MELSVRFNLDYCQLCCQLLEGRDQPAPTVVGEGAEGGQLADTAGGRCQQRQPKRQADEDACVVDQGIRDEAEPELGGTADGPAGELDATPGPLVNRVDRLRLLGNGVVNQTAAKAFATLSARLTDYLEME